MKKTFYTSISTFYILCLIYSCEKEVNTESIETQAQTFGLTEEINSHNGVLIFRDSLAFKNAFKNLSRMSRKEVSDWERSFNFISQSTIFGNIVDAENKIDELYERMTQEDRKNAMPPPHSPLYYELLDYGMIKIIKNSEDPEYESYDYSVCLPHLSPLINIDGIYMIGNTIYQVTSTSIREWKNGDINNLDKLKSTKEESKEIKIYYVLNKEIGHNLKGELSPNPISSGWIYKGSNRRMKLEIYFISWKYLGDGTVWRYQHYSHVRSEKKNWLGQWKLNWTDMYIRGTWESNILCLLHKPYLNISYINYYPQFPSNFPSYHHGYINNYYSSISIFDGSISPHPAIWNVQYYHNDEYAEIVDIILPHANWEAICHGDAYANIEF